MEGTMNVFREFFGMPNEDKAVLFSEDIYKATRVSASNNSDNEEFHFWRDNLRHPCYPLDADVHLWPKETERYRDVVGAYSVNVGNLLSQILALISEGFGLESSFFGEELTKIQLLSANHYPPCHDPSLTLGLPKHCDPNLVTSVHQGDIAGLQVFKDGQWIGVEALRNAFVINIGYQLQIITNGKLKCVEHRAVTNSSRARTTIVTFINPDMNCIIEPARALLNNNPLLYRSFQYGEFLKSFTAKVGEPETVLEPFKVKT